jgi:hypothetical protein
MARIFDILEYDDGEEYVAIELLTVQGQTVAPRQPRIALL